MKYFKIPRYDLFGQESQSSRHFFHIFVTGLFVVFVWLLDCLIFNDFFTVESALSFSWMPI